MNAQLLKSFEPLGFSAHEAKAYVTLLEHGRQTGYELAKRAQIPRPNIYPILQRLEKRGIVSSVRDGQRALYDALPAAQMTAKLSGHFKAQMGQVKEALDRMPLPAPPEVAWNIQGREAVLTKAAALIRQASTRLQLGLWSTEAAELAEPMAKAQARGIELSVLCIQGCERECGGCQGKIYRYPIAAQAKTRWLVVSVDDNEILLAQFLPDGAALGIHSPLNVLVSVGSHYLSNAIAVAEIFRSGGRDLLRRMDAAALEAIQGAGLADVFLKKN